MIKVFLVEDEMLIRQSVKNSIQWEKEGYEFVGEAGDGELALPMILKEKPDIVITDIRMPFMDGLELSKLIRQELPEVKIIILSGYDEFEYAKEAIKIGVVEYLLKPISSAKLLETLKEVSSTIQQEKEEKGLREIYQQEMQENIELKKIKFFGELISGNLSLADAVNEGKKYEMNLSAGVYQIILFKFLNQGSSAEEVEILLQAYEKIETAMSELSFVSRFQRSVNGWAFLLTADDEKEMESRKIQVITALEEIVRQHKSIEYFGGIGMPVFRLREVKNSFEDADKAFSGRFTYETNQIITSSEIKMAGNEDFETDSFGDLEQIHQAVEKFLNNGTLEEVHSFVKACLQEIPEESFRSLMVRQYIMMDIYVAVMSFSEKLQNENGSAPEGKQLEENGEQLKRAVSTAESVKDIEIYVEHLIEKAIEIRNTVSGRRYSDIMEMSQNLIKEKYMTEDISLNSVAAHVGMSPSYFSTIFSREMDQTFVEYLTQVRMEKAKELLVCSSMKTSEVGYEVGYKDPHYFSFIFKKTQGCSPKEYRAKRKG